MTYPFLAVGVLVETGVVVFIVLIAVLNLALGYLLAAALAEPPFWEAWQPVWTGWTARTKSQPHPALATDDGRTTQPAPAVLSPAPAAPEAASADAFGDLPAQWLDQLTAEGLFPQSFVEGVAHVLRLEASRYREHLIAAENRGRALTASSDVPGLKLLADDLRFINQEWLDKQTAAAEMLSRRGAVGTIPWDRTGDHGAAAETMEQLLLDQSAAVRSVIAALAGPPLGPDAATTGAALAAHIATLIDQAHTLRDRMLDLSATLLHSGNRLQSLGSACQVDRTTGLPNRIGLEALLDAWWREDPQRARPLSVVLIDIDRFARVNQRLGTRAGDQAIVAFSQLFNDIVRRDRGYDRLARVGGESFLIIMGDTRPHEALAGAERLRQTVEATTFDNQGVEFEQTVSCGVTDVRSADTVPGLLRRAGETLLCAKKAGRNRCAVDEGQGATLLDPPQFPVKGRTVKLGEL